MLDINHEIYYVPSTVDLSSSVDSRWMVKNYGEEWMIGYGEEQNTIICTPFEKEEVTLFLFVC
jgi:hypothetical protein